MQRGGLGDGSSPATFVDDMTEYVGPCLGAFSQRTPQIENFAKDPTKDLHKKAQRALSGASIVIGLPLSTHTTLRP